MPPPAIEVADLVKIYGSLRAVDGVSFQVQPGQIFGLLGPNGAGKSTTIEMLEGLRHADGGTIRVLGIDVRREPRRVKERIGVQLQSTAFFKQLTIRQLLRLFGSFFPVALPVEKLIGMVNLEEKADNPSGDLSGGQRQRLAIAVALVNDPAVVFLDEPTTGLDPQARRSLWDVIRQLPRRRQDGPAHHPLPRRGRTTLRPPRLHRPRQGHRPGHPGGSHRREFRAHHPGVSHRRETPRETLEALPAVDRWEEANGHVRLSSSHATETTRALMSLCAERGVELRAFSVHTATLEDVFLKLTGRRIRE